MLEDLAKEVYFPPPTRHRAILGGGDPENAEEWDGRGMSQMIHQWTVESTEGGRGWRKLQRCFEV